MRFYFLRLEGRPRPDPVPTLARLTRRLTAPPVIYLLLALLPVGFLLLETVRSQPFIDDFPTYDVGDDWYTYRVLAESVLHDGWTMPAMPRNFARPGGFLYVYFVAGVMSLLGENSTKVYLVQSFLLGLTVVITHLGFGRRLSPGARVAYLGATALFLYLDAFRNYTNRLLSENLIIILLPITLACLLWVHERPSAGRGVIAGLALGAAILTRPNVLLLGPAAAVLLIIYRRPGDRTVRAALALLGGSLAIMGVMGLRNYIVTGEPGAGVFTYTGDWIRPRIAADAGPLEQGWAVARHYGRRVLFVLGAAPVLVPAYRVRPHWLVMWAGVAAFGMTTWRRPVAFWEAVLVGSLVVYIGPLVAVAHIANYGVRMIVPAVPLVLLLTIRGVERWRFDEPGQGRLDGGPTPGGV